MAKNFNIVAEGYCLFSGIGKDHALRIAFGEYDWSNAGIYHDLVCSRAFADDPSSNTRWCFLYPKPLLLGRAPKSHSRFLRDGNQLRIKMSRSCSSKNFKGRKVIWQRNSQGTIRVQVPSVCVPYKSLFKEFPFRGSTEILKQGILQQDIVESDLYVLGLDDGSINPFLSLDKCASFIEQQRIKGSNSRLFVVKTLFRS